MPDNCNIVFNMLHILFVLLLDVTLNLGGASMKVCYINSIKEFVDFNIFTMKLDSSNIRRLRILKFSIPVICICSIVLYLYFIPYDSNDIEFKIFFILCIILSLSSIIFYSKFYYWLVRRALYKQFEASNNLNILSETVIELNENGISASAEKEYHMIPWSSVRKVNVTDRYIYIYLSILNGIVIPFNAFNNISEKEEFLTFINTHIDVNKS